MTGAYNRFIYLHYFTISVHTFTNLQMQGLCSPHAPPSQRSSTSDSLACTSTATSIGDPSSHRVRCLWEQPSAVASESDHGSSKVRHSSSSMADPQSCDCHRLLDSGSPSSLPCLSSVSVDGSLGSTSSHSSPSSYSSSSSCSSSSSSDVEELAGQLTRWLAPSLHHLGCLLGDARHIVCQSHGRFLLHPS